MTEGTLRIGTRGSPLALWQANTVARLLEATGVRVEIVVIKTTGDRLQERPLSEAGGKRLFVKEIEDAMLRHEVDIAVHSAKDMPAVLPEGLAVAATLPREDPRDALVLPDGGGAGDLASVVAQLGAAPGIGTSSVRRTAQLTSVIPNARFGAIRGNVDTRLAKVDRREFDAIVLASAGLRRLGFGSRISAAIPIEACIPAPGQGIVAVEIRTDHEDARARLARIHDTTAGIALEAERALVVALGGGCQLPLGGIAVPDGASLEMHAVVASLDGRRVVRRHAQGSIDDPAALGKRIADDLASGGATEILDEVRHL